MHSVGVALALVTVVLNAVAALVGAWAWQRFAAPRAFWIGLRAGQGAAVAQAVFAGIAAAAGSRPDDGLYWLGTTRLCEADPDKPWTYDDRINEWFQAHPGMVLGELRPKLHAVDKGGWRYLRLRGIEHPDSDLSITAWQLMFLRSARNASYSGSTVGGGSRPFSK